MEVERIQRGGHVFYRIWSEYSKDSLAVTAQDLRDIYVWYTLHMREVGEDAQREKQGFEPFETIDPGEPEDYRKNLLPYHDEED